MGNRINWEIILKYLDETANREEESWLQEWLTTTENRKTLEKIIKIWEFPETLLPAPDIENAWQKCIEKTGIQPTLLDHPPPQQVRFHVTQFISQLFDSKILRYAAIILFIIITPILINRLVKTENWKEVSVPNAQRITVVLSDRSKVILDAGSTLRYPERFSKRNRKVYLNGEGYFEVTSQPEKPFIVHANHAMVKVIGTRFNIRAWPAHPESMVAVTVAEGKVSLGPENQESEIILSKGQYSELTKNKYPTIPRNVDIDQHLSWLHREIYFQNVPLSEVLDQLERWYDVKITIKDSSLVSDRVTVFIAERPLKDLLEVISLMNNVRFEQVGKEIILSKNN